MKIRDVVRIEIEMDQKMIPELKKSSSEYYELKVQLRFERFEDIDVLKKNVLSYLEKQNLDINKVEELKNGFDIYFRNHSSMNTLSHYFSKRFLVYEKRSKKLVGRDNLISKDKYRYFQSLRIVRIVKGEQVKVKGKLYEVVHVKGNDLVLKVLETGQKKTFTYSVIKDYLLFSN